MAMFRRTPPPVTGTSNAGGVVKIAILASSRVVNDPTAKSKITHTAAPDRGVVLLFAKDVRRSVYDKKPQRYAKDSTNRI